MSFWGDLAGGLAEKLMSGQDINLLQVAEQALGNSGGVGGLLDNLRGAGLGDQVASWIGTGSNLPVSAEQIQSALSGDQLSGIATALGLDPDKLPAILSQLLPAAVDKASPNGVLPS